MDRVATVFLTLLALSCSQVLDTLNLGQSVTDILQPTSVGGLNEHLYRVFVPEGISSLQVTVTYTGNSASCPSGIDLYSRTGSAACNYNQFADGKHRLCYGSEFEGTATSSAPATGSFYPAYLNVERQVDFRVSDYWFFSVSKHSKSDADKSCSYSIQVTAKQACSSGSVAVSSDYTSDVFTCVAYTSVLGNSFQDSLKNVASAFTVYKLNVSQDASYVELAITSSRSSLSVVGQSYALSTVNGFSCASSDPVGSNGRYVSSARCYLPRKGAYYFLIQNPYIASANPTFNANVTITQSVCTSSALIGASCNSPATNLNTLVNTSVSNVANYRKSVAANQIAYYYFDAADVLAASTNLSVKLWVNSSDNGFFYIRKDGAPSDSVRGYEGNSEWTYFTSPSSASSNYKVLNYYDFVNGGRWYIGVECYQASSCDTTLFVSVSGVNFNAPSIIQLPIDVPDVPVSIPTPNSPTPVPTASTGRGSTTKSSTSKVASSSGSITNGGQGSSTESSTESTSTDGVLQNNLIDASAASSNISNLASLLVLVVMVSLLTL